MPHLLPHARDAELATRVRGLPRERPLNPSAYLGLLSLRETTATALEAVVSSDIVGRPRWGESENPRLSAIAASTISDGGGSDPRRKQIMGGLGEPNSG